MIESFHPSGSASVNSGNTLPAAINRNLKYVGSTNNPLLYWVRYINFLPWTRRWKQDQQFLRDTVSKLLEDKRAEISTSESSTVKGQYSDILHLLLESKDDLVEDGGKSTGLNDLEILSNSVMFVIAGSDTTSNTLGFLMIELCENPQYMAQLVAEIRKLPIDKSTGRIDASFLKSGSTSCKFLDACVYETLRLHPVAPGNLE